MNRLPTKPRFVPSTHAFIGGLARFWILTAGVTLVGCSDPGGPSIQAEGLVYRIGGDPLFSVGGEASGPTSDLFQVKGAVRFPDGGILIGDGAHRVLRFDADGTYLGSFGGRGQGPGEFGTITWMRRVPPDSVVFYDGVESRVSLFTAAGEHVHSVRLNGTVGRLADGSLIARRGVEAVPMARGQIIRRANGQLVQTDPEGRVTHSIGTFPMDESVVLEHLPFDFVANAVLRLTTFATGPDVVYVATGDRFEVRRFPIEGGEPVIFRKDHELVPITADEAFEFFASWRDGFFGDRLRRADFDAFPSDQTLPAITRLLLADTGDLWAQGTIEQDAPERGWSVFTTEGEFAGTATVPASFRPFQIGEDFILGVSRDSLDVERVELRSLSAVRVGSDASR